jgi:peptidoglycan-N-acetylglucosamine deacetylase
MFLIFTLRPYLVRCAAIAALFFVAAAIRAGYLRTVSTSVSVLPPLTRVETADNRVALTFDVTWGEVELAKILGILQQEQVSATFFAGGSFMVSYPERVKAIAAAGHEVGTLGQRIVDLSLLAEQEVRVNLLGAQSLMEKAVGAPVRFFRPPQGTPTNAVLRAAHDASLQTVLFSLDAGDTYGMNPQQIVNRVLRRARRGDIIRLSASDFSPATSKALPDLIRGLKAKGLALVRVSDLLPAAAPLTGSRP